MMVKFDAENVPEKCDFRIHFDSPGGRREVRRASLRRRRFADAGFSYLKRLTPAGVGGFWDPPKSQNGSKIALLCIDWRLDPPKMVSGRGFGTNRKINEKIIQKRTKHHEKMISKFIEKLILFRICDSLFFAKSPLLK